MPFQLLFDLSAMNNGTRKSLSVNCCLMSVKKQKDPKKCVEYSPFDETHGLALLSSVVC